MAQNNLATRVTYDVCHGHRLGKSTDARVLCDVRHWDSVCRSGYQRAVCDAGIGHGCTEVA
eukprot:2818860-Rhodomonas_salina.3